MFLVLDFYYIFNCLMIHSNLARTDLVNLHVSQTISPNTYHPTFFLPK